MKEDQGTIQKKKNTMQRTGYPKEKGEWVNMGMAGRKREKDLGKFCVPHTMTCIRYMINELDVVLVLKM